MFHLVHIFFLTPIEFLLGFFCLLSAIALYPNEEGKIQSRFEDFWIRVDDYQELALSRHTAFLQQVAGLETRFLDRVFGIRLFSPQAIGVSFACSFLTLGGYSQYDTIVNGVESDWEYLGPSIYFLLALALGAACIYIRSRRIIAIIVSSVFVLTLLAPLLALANPQSNREEIQTSMMMIYGVMLLGFFCDAFFAMSTRRLVRFVQQVRTTIGIIVVLLLNLLLAIALTYPLHAYRNYDVNEERASSVLYFAALSNILDVVLALVFAILVMTLLIHRAFWPLLNRTLFRITEIGTKGRRGILMTVGLALLGLSGAELPDLLKELAKALE